MNRRILINIAVFATLGVVMTIWAFRNVISFDFISKPYHIYAEFQSSPGLHPNFEVDYLGTRIGKIDSVRLTGNRVRVKLDIERGVQIPQAVTAAAARKSAVGEPVVELTPITGQTGGAAMRPGTTIPVSRTSVPPSYTDLFGAVIRTIQAIDPADAKVLTHELALGWAGRQDSLRQIINGTDQLTGTFAENSELLDGLTKDLAKITNVLAQNRGQLAAGIDNSAVLLDALADVRTELAKIRDRAPSLLSDVNGLLEASGKDLDCSLSSLGSFVPSLATPDRLADLRQVLVQAPRLNYVLRNVVGRDQGQPVLNVIFIVTLRKQAALEYRYPLKQPQIGKIPTCPDGRMPALTKQKKFVGGSTGDTLPRHNPDLDKPATAVRNAGNGSANSSGGGPPAWLVYVPPVIALLVLIKVMAGSVPVLARRRRRKD